MSQLQPWMPTQPQIFEDEYHWDSWLKSTPKFIIIGHQVNSPEQEEVYLADKEGEIIDHIDLDIVSAQVNTQHLASGEWLEVRFKGECVFNKTSFLITQVVHIPDGYEWDYGKGYELKESSDA